MRVFYKGIPMHGADQKSFSTITRPESSKLNLNTVAGIDYKFNKKRIYQSGNLIKEI